MTNTRFHQLVVGILALLLCLALGAGCDLAQETGYVSTQAPARVVRVIDGDTFEIQGGERVRLIGLDCPEARSPGGAEATAYTRMEIEGKEVTLEKDTKDRDRYGRLLRYVYIDGTLLNRKIVEDGYAVAKSYPPDTKHQGELEEAEEIARKRGAGLWSVGGIFE